MQFSVENLTGLERRLTITVPKTDLRYKVDQRIRNLAQTTIIAGFRPGKTPLGLIIKRYGDQVRYETLQEFIQDNLEKALRESQLNAVNPPVIEHILNDELTNNDDVRCVFKLEILPEINLVPLETLTVDKAILEVLDSDVDKMVEFFRQQNQTWDIVTDRAAQIGDRLRIDFFGKLSDGSNFPGNTGADVLVVLGTNTFVAGFEHQLIGTRAGETVTVEISFPSDYHQSELAGHNAVFQVTIKTLEGATLPEVDSEFMSHFGVVDGSIEDFRQKIRYAIERDLQHKSWEITKESVLEELYQRHPVELPQTLIEEEMNRFRAEISEKAVQPDEATILAQVRRRVALGMIIGEIGRVNKVRPTTRRVRDYVRNLSEDYENADAVERYWLSDKNRSKEIEAVIFEDMVVEFILTKAQINERRALFGDLMSIGTQIKKNSVII